MIYSQVRKSISSTLYTEKTEIGTTTLVIQVNARTNVMLIAVDRVTIILIELLHDLSI